jgi:ABC-2 type transport system permease protein
MTAIISMIIKELRQIRRDRRTLAMIFMMPLIQIVIMGHAITTDINHLSTAITDLDRTPLSRSIIESFVHSKLFDVLVTPETPDDLELALRRGSASVGILIPRGFSRQVYRGESPNIAIWIDGVDSNAGLIAGGYASSLLLLKARQLLRDITQIQSLPAEPRFKILYNPQLESSLYMIPGIVSTLLVMMTSILTSIAIVREREMGTLEQLMVTPLRKIELMVGKIVPFMILGFIQFMVALMVAKTVFSIPFVGSIFDIMGLALIFLLTTLGTGLFVSTLASTQQQAQFFSWFFNMFTMLMSGFFFPIANMPLLLQRVTLINPLRYFMEAIRDIILKGATWHDLLPQITALLILGGTLFFTAAFRFNKRME